MLIAGPAAYICEECVKLSTDIMFDPPPLTLTPDQEAAQNRVLVLFDGIKDFETKGLMVRAFLSLKQSKTVEQLLAILLTGLSSEERTAALLQLETLLTDLRRHQPE